MSRALVIVDIQNDYFPGGAYPLVGPEEAAAAARMVLEVYRERGEAVVHVQHVWDAADASFMRSGTAGVEIHESGLPRTRVSRLSRRHTRMRSSTRRWSRNCATAGSTTWSFCGMMTSMCVDATVRAAVDLGFQATVVHDACAAPDLEFAGETIPAPAVRGAFIAALGDSYADVRSADELVTGR